MAEGIAQISQATVGRMRSLGRDSMGRTRFEKVCPRRSMKMLDDGGNEVDVPIVNGRVFTVQSREKYGRPLIRELIKEGNYLPKDLCPLTRRYEDLVGGPLVAPKDKRDSECRSDEIGEHGCKHYQAIKAARRKENATLAAARKAALGKADERTIRAMAEGFKMAFAGAGNSTDPRAAINAQRREGKGGE